MKKLILIQNDYPSTGKSTLAHCCSRYLSMHGVSHQLIHLVDDASDDTSGLRLDASSFKTETLLDHLDSSPITLLEVETGMGDFFEKFYQNQQLDLVLREASVGLSVVLPVSSDADSFDSVIEAAEVFSDNAEYTIAHLVTSSYEDDDRAWDSSYAARVMDMFEAVELYIPEIGMNLETELRAHHASLDDALLDPMADEHYGKDFTKWMDRVLAQLEGARRYLFGEAFRPTQFPAKTAEKKSRGRPRTARAA